MQITVTYHGESKGSLTVEQKGLYMHFSAVCTVQQTQPLHLFGICGLSSRPIGVLSRDGTLDKKYSLRTAQPLPEAAILGRAEDGFLPWCGNIEGERLSDAYLKQENGQYILALPVSEGGEVPLLAYASQMRQQTVCGRPCLCLPLQDGSPVRQPETADRAEPTEVLDCPETDMRSDLPQSEDAEQSIGI